MFILFHFKAKKGLVKDLGNFLFFFQSKHKNSVLNCASFSLVCFLRKNMYLELVLPTLTNACLFVCLWFFLFVCFYDKVVITGIIGSIEGMDVSITMKTET